MPQPKIVILGAGSLFFGRKAIWQAVHSPHLHTGTLALVDTDADRLDKMKRLAEMVIAHNDSPLKLEASVDRRDVLPGADFIVLSFADRNAHFRGVDCEISERHGIRMCSGDTIGPGGVFRTMREFPVILDACRDIENLCPEAWVINYINPAAVHGIGIKRYFPGLKSMALCDAQFGLRKRFANAAGVEDDDKLTVLTAGPNHFTWTIKADYDGEDILPRVIDSMRAKAEADLNTQAQGKATQAKGWHNNSIALELYDAMGLLPTVLGHTKEYVPFYQGRNVNQPDTHPPLKLFEVPQRVKWTNEVWQRVDEYLSGAAPIAEFDTEFEADPATTLIETMWAGLDRPQFINTFNEGAIPNMADDAFVELYCDIDMAGPRPHPVGDMPRGIRAMCETVLDTHELTAKAVHDGDLGLLRRALITDPLTTSIGDTDALIADLLEAEHDALPEHWYESAAIS